MVETDLDKTLSDLYNNLEKASSYIDFKNYIDRKKYCNTIASIGYNLNLEDVFGDVIKGKFPNKIPKIPVGEACTAIIFRTLALKINTGLGESKIKWQLYWLRCCLSKDCDYVFSILGSDTIGINRETDILDIMTDKTLWKHYSTGAKNYYVMLSIYFLLKRYCWNYSFFKENQSLLLNNIGFLNLFFPRMLSAILIGFIPIITSDQFSIFALHNQSQLYIYTLSMIILSFIYLLFECYKNTQWVLSISDLIGAVKRFLFCTPKSSHMEKQSCASKISYKEELSQELLKRVSRVLFCGLTFSFVFSYFLSKIGLIGTNYIYEDKWCWTILLFYSSLAYFIGIIVQLLWEDKTVTEPF